MHCLEQFLQRTNRTFIFFSVLPFIYDKQLKGRKRRKTEDRVIKRKTEDQLARTSDYYAFGEVLHISILICNTNVWNKW